MKARRNVFDTEKEVIFPHNRVVGGIVGQGGHNEWLRQKDGHGGDGFILVPRPTHPIVVGSSVSFLAPRPVLFLFLAQEIKKAPPLP